MLKALAVVALVVACLSPSLRDSVKVYAITAVHMVEK